MLLVTQASASWGASQRGIEIPGDMVVGVFRNDFAVRMLAASVDVGIEAPIRFHLPETPDGRSSLRYRIPSVLFAAYPEGGPALQELAEELDAIFASIAARASGR